MVVAFKKSHLFNELNEVSIFELANALYLDRLHCEFRHEYIELTKTSGTSLNVVMSSEKEDWIFEFLEKGLGVSIVPESSITSPNIGHKKIKEFEKGKRKINLLMTDQAAKTFPVLGILRQEAEQFNWK